jgi:hypothetical protein
MTALVEEGHNGAISLAGHDYRIFAHVAHKVIARVLDLAFRAKQEPGTREDALKLEPIDFGVRVDACANCPRVWIDEVRKTGGEGRPSGA